MEDITFNKKNNVWVADIVSTGNTTVQIDRKHRGGLSILKYIDTLTPVPHMSFGALTSKSVMFELELPAGVKARIISYTEVESAKSV